MIICITINFIALLITLFLSEIIFIVICLSSVHDISAITFFISNILRSTCSYCTSGDSHCDITIRSAGCAYSDFFCLHEKEEEKNETIHKRGY